MERARELFREGVALMAAEDFAGALVKFKEVGRVRMSSQVAFNIAECEEKLGRVVAALGNYRLALAKASEGGAAKVEQFAPERIKALEQRVAKLVIQRKEPKKNPAAKLELDGVEVAAGQLGSAVPVDPGDHTLRVLVDGKAVSTQALKLADGENKTVEIMIPAPKEPGEVVGPGAEPASTVSVPGAVLTALGGGMLVLGGVFLGLRQGAISELDDVCGGDRSCPASAEATYDEGRLYTGLAEGFIPAGVVTATVGIVLLALKASSSSGAEDAGVSWFAPPTDGPGAGVRVAF